MQCTSPSTVITITSIDLITSPVLSSSSSSFFTDCITHKTKSFQTT